MSERYTKVFSLKENLYATDAPILISAGALTKDNQTGKVFTQLRLQNIDSIYRNIIALKITITTYDPAGNILENSKEYQYLDLNVSRGEEFGSKQAISLDNQSARSFNVHILEVVFSDETSWTANKQEWVSLGKQKTLEEAMGNELAEQYRRSIFSKAKYEIFANNGVWMCACGALNEIGESQCCMCHNKKSELLNALDHDFLSAALKAHNEKRIIEVKKKDRIIKSVISSVIIILLIFVYFQIISPMLSEKKAQPVINALDGTTWDSERTAPIKFYHDTMYYVGSSDSYGEWKMVDIDDNVMEITIDFRRYEQKMEVHYVNSGGVILITGLRGLLPGTYDDWVEFYKVIYG